MEKVQNSKVKKTAKVLGYGACMTTYILLKISGAVVDFSSYLLKLNQKAEEKERIKKMAAKGNIKGIEKIITKRLNEEKLADKKDPYSIRFTVPSVKAANALLNW
jgi:hypothetical protein